jgi:hypothetical protein
VECLAFYKLGDYELYYDTILQSQKVEFRNNTELNAYGDLKEKISAPLYQQAFRWFRENYNKHNVPLGTLRLADEKVIFHINGPRNPVAFEKVYDTYEEAQIACLKMLIDSVIKQKEQ